MDNYKKAIDELLIEIARKIPQEHVKYPIKAYIVGGFARFYGLRNGLDDLRFNQYKNTGSF